MSSEWPEVALGAIAEEVTVGHVGPMASRYVDTGIPFLRSQNVRRLRLDLTDVKFIPPEFHRELSKSRLRPGDVLVVRTGEPGACVVVPDALVGANCADLVIIRPGPRLNARFLSYYVNEAAVHHVASHLVGAVQQHFNVGAARLLPMRLPSIEEQGAIVGVLGALDDKIEQNRRTGLALEGLARATFKAWFVDFEPVKAKAAGATSFPGMSVDAFAALPDRLTDSPLGPVPEGWEVRPVSEVCRIVSGGTPKRSVAEFWDGDVPWYSLKDAPPDGMPWVDSTDEQISEAGLEGSAATQVPVGCTIISARGTVGRLALVARPMAFNQSCYGLLPIDGDSYRHLYLLLRQIVVELQQRTHGSVFDTITRQTFDGVSVVRPGSSLLEQFERAVAPSFDLLLSLLTESSKLAELRDYLMPRLLSGRVRVRPSQPEVKG